MYKKELENMEKRIEEKTEKTKKTEGKINFEELLATAVKLPLVCINREDFLRRELQKYCDDDVVTEAIEHNPAYAGIPSRTISRIADSCIKFETAKVSTISFAAGIPGGFAMIGTLPADFIQYYAHVLRIMQKLAYLYGWEELIGEDGAMDDETNHLLILFTGVMFGVNGAVAAVNKLSAQIASKVVKTLPQKALTKGLIYPIVKKVATLLGIKMSKDIFAKGVSKLIPIVGGVVSGGVTFASYMPMAKKFKKYLSGLKPADVNYYKKIKEGKETEYIEANFSESEVEIISESIQQEIDETYKENKQNEYPAQDDENEVTEIAE